MIYAVINDVSSGCWAIWPRSWWRRRSKGKSHLELNIMFLYIYYEVIS